MNSVNFGNVEKETVKLHGSLFTILLKIETGFKKKNIYSLSNLLTAPLNPF